MARKPRVAGARVHVATEVFIDGAREFFTIGPEAIAWCPPIHLAVDDAEIKAIIEKSTGAFVRLEPPAEATEEQVARIKKICEMAGAVRVQVLGRRRAAAVTAPKEKLPHRKAREVVEELVREACYAEKDWDRNALGSFVEEIMARRGL
jgi:hypothetical protein